MLSVVLFNASQCVQIVRLLRIRFGGAWRFDFLLPLTHKCKWKCLLQMIFKLKEEESGIPWNFELCCVPRRANYFHSWAQKMFPFFISKNQTFNSDLFRGDWLWIICPITHSNEFAGASLMNSSMTLVICSFCFSYPRQISQFSQTPN